MDKKIPTKKKGFNKLPEAVQEKISPKLAKEFNMGGMVDKRSPFMGGGIAYAGGGRAMKREMYATGSKSGRTKKKTEAGAVARKQTAKTTGEKVMKAVKTIGKIVVPGAAAVDAGVRLSKFLNRKK